MGTGRNARFYKLGQCDSLTFVDQSASMVATAQAKFKGVCGSGIQALPIPRGKHK